MLAFVRIVSLLPSATEICFALGLGDELVGRTHECDYPPEAFDSPGADDGCRRDRERRRAARSTTGWRRHVHGGESIYRLGRGRAGAGRSGPDPDPGAVRRVRRVVPRRCRGRPPGRHGQRDRQPRADEHRGHLQLDLDRRRDGRGGGRGRRPDRAPARAPRAHREPRPRAAPRGPAAAPRRCRSNGSTRPSRPGTGCPSRSGAQVAGICSATPASRPRRRPGNSVRDVEPEMLVLMPCGFDAARTADEWHDSRASAAGVGRRPRRRAQRRGLRGRRIGLLQPAGAARHRRHRAAGRDLRSGRVHRSRCPTARSSRLPAFA